MGYIWLCLAQLEHDPARARRTGTPKTERARKMPLPLRWSWEGRD